MSFKLIKLLFVPMITILILLSSIFLERTLHPEAMIAIGVLFIISIITDHWFSKRYKIVQLILLVMLHYVSQLNWCVLLYYILTVNIIEGKTRLRDTFPIAMLLMTLYTVIRLTYVPYTTYNVLVSMFDFMTSLVLLMLLQAMARIEFERKDLTKRNDFLTNYDPLTGLLNYNGFIRKVQKLVKKKREFTLLMLDINNFRSLNAKDVFTANDILVNFTLSLQGRFPNYLGAARYAGDRFAVLLPNSEQVDHMLVFDKLGIQVTYSVTRFPSEAQDFQELIQIGEDQIFQMRREQWLKHQEEQMRMDKMRMIGELAAGMAHEIRNPLTSIKGFIQLSKSSSYNIQPWYDVIMEEISRVGELTVEFLQFSKQHTRNMKQEAIANCVSRVYSLCESDAASRGLTIGLEISDHSLMVLMDRDKIIQVLINLIQNAFQAIEDGGHVQIILQQEGKMAAIHVCDNGLGISENTLHQIFDPFYTTKEDGTGLGLPLCQKIIDDHQGQISVTSEVGVGSVFTVRLPLYMESSEG